MTAKVHKQIWVTAEQQNALRALSENTRIPQAAYYREAIDMVIEKYAKQLKEDDGD